MIRHLRNGTVIECIETGSRVTLPDGTVVLGTPHDTDEYRATARRIEYGDDAMAMARAHDPLHAVLCDWLNLPDSPALRRSAGLDGDATIAAAEEDAVLSLQRFCRLAGVNLFVAED